MAVFGQRSPGYKVGFFLLFVGLVLYSTGFGLPYWVTYTIDIDAFGEIKGHDGLWERCIRWGETSMCYSATSNAEGWYRIVQGVQCGGLICFIFACLSGIVVNFCQRQPSFNRYVECCAYPGFVLGVAGLVVFVIKTQEGLDDLEEMNVRQLYGVKIEDITYHAGFALNAVGCALSLPGAVLVTCYNRTLTAPANSAAASSYGTATPYATAEVRGGQVYYAPGQTPTQGLYPSLQELHAPYSVAVVQPPPYTVSQDNVQMTFNGTKM